MSSWSAMIAVKEWSDLPGMTTWSYNVFVGAQERDSGLQAQQSGGCQIRPKLKEFGGQKNTTSHRFTEKYVERRVFVQQHNTMCYVVQL